MDRNGLRWGIICGYRERIIFKWTYIVRRTIEEKNAVHLRMDRVFSGPGERAFYYTVATYHDILSN